MLKTKICSQCGNELPMEMFVKSSRGKGGRASKCKVCNKEYREQHPEGKAEYAKLYQKENKERLSEYKKQHYELNKDKVKKRSKDYRQSHKGYLREYHKQYAQDNKEKLSERIMKYRESHKEQRKEYEQKNKEYIAERAKQYHQDNKERISEYGRKYRLDNIERITERCSRWRKENKGIVNTKTNLRKSLKNGLSSTLTAEQWELIKQNFNNCCAYCGKELPLAQEHFIPLSTGGEYTHNNIIPACRRCNSSKHDRAFTDWYPRYEYYSKKREAFILKFLNYKNGIQQLALM